MAEELDPDDLIGAAEVQAILRLSHPSSVTTYYRRYPDFPKPVVDLSSSPSPPVEAPGDRGIAARREAE